jgi:hypothetical protein
MEKSIFFKMEKSKIFKMENNKIKNMNNLIESINKKRIKKKG